MKKINFLKVFGILSCIYSVLLIVIPIMEGYRLMLFGGYILYGCMLTASVCMVAGKKLCEKILPWAVSGIALYWLVTSITDAVLYLWLYTIAYIIFAICLFNRKRKKSMLTGAIAAICLVSLKFIMVETDIIFDIYLLGVTAFGILFDFAMMMYFNSKIGGDGEENAVKAEKEPTVEEVILPEVIITAEEAETELRFLEFQFEKNYITEEEYQEKRAEFLMKVSKL